ncbi:MAG: helix-turn-helix transcriptional regulator [Lachnospiraceae bacterium]|nr:helix-turn-helix transcriptional regulator [Lachnospiraceae bacterium]
MAIDKSLIQGSLAMLILRLLDEKDMYGYEMIETLRGRSNNVFELKAGSLYPLLHSLEEKNYVTAYEDDSSGKTRKYYHLSGEGKRFLKEKKEEWEVYSTAVSSVLTLAY